MYPYAKMHKKGAEFSALYVYLLSKKSVAFQSF